jgi:hypothetical protein
MSGGGALGHGGKEAVPGWEYLHVLGTHQAGQLAYTFFP